MMRKEDVEKLYKQGVVVDLSIVFSPNGIFVKYLLNNGDSGFLQGWDRRKGNRRFRSLDSAFRSILKICNKVSVVVYRV
ncbi:MAG: hypothetical protein HQL75_18335 [Magnetococcales bacterium]|nr:hypothetical protein [Magnetococcales bacterium]